MISNYMNHEEIKFCAHQFENWIFGRLFCDVGCALNPCYGFLVCKILTLSLTHPGFVPVVQAV